jgi:mRNA-degrading endonuclease RelE of RelBE toxin-antitoxin system
LEIEPLSGDVVKVQGKEDIYRLRVDSYRVYFRLDSHDKSIDILLIDNKAAVKEKRIQRLVV